VSKGRSRVPSAFVPLIVGLIGLFNVVRQPRFEAIHTVDFVQMVASGMCFGVALVAVIAFFRGSRNS
jgi:hypothetical protein